MPCSNEGMQLLALTKVLPSRRPLSCDLCWGYNQYPIAPSLATANSKWQNVPILCLALALDRHKNPSQKEWNTTSACFTWKQMVKQHSSFTDIVSLTQASGRSFFSRNQRSPKAGKENDFVDHLTTEWYLHLKWSRKKPTRQCMFNPHRKAYGESQAHRHLAKAFSSRRGLLSTQARE